MTVGAPDHTKVLKRQDFEVYRATAKAPSFRRAVAGFIDLSVVAVPAGYYYQQTGSYFSAAVPLVYFLFRDYLCGSRSFGKLLMGLVVVDYKTLSPISIPQCLVRNSLYSLICPILILAGAAFSAASILVLPFGLLVLAASQMRVLSVIGYDERDGTTIPDSWAETQVLTPKEIRKIRAYEAKLNRPAEQGMDDQDAASSQLKV